MKLTCSSWTARHFIFGLIESKIVEADRFGQPMKNILLCLVLAALSGCSADREDPSVATGSIVLAVLPDQSEDALRSRHDPLLEYLEEATSLVIEFVIPRDYADLVDQFDAGHIDLAWFGGLTFTQAQERSQAVPLAFRDIDLQFTSCYLAKTAESRSTVREFEAADFSFGPRLSTSGHLMPRYFLESRGIYPEHFFESVRHSSSHDQTARWVRDGIVEMGVANCIIAQAMFENGSLDNSDVRVIETTPPYSNYVWATQPSMDDRTRTVILDALLALSAADPKHRAILRSQGANAYLPAAPGNFVLVRKAAKRTGFLGNEDEN